MIKKATKIALQKQYIKTEVITLKTNYEEKAWSCLLLDMESWASYSLSQNLQVRI